MSLLTFCQLSALQPAPFDGYTWLSLTLGSFPMEILFFPFFYEKLCFHFADAGSQKEKTTWRVQILSTYQLQSKLRLLTQAHFSQMPRSHERISPCPYVLFLVSAGVVHSTLTKKNLLWACQTEVTSYIFGRAHLNIHQAGF